MGWKEERDALIAQTLAFVEQVTGKPVDLAQLASPPAPLPGGRQLEPAPTSTDAFPREHDAQPARDSSYGMARAGASIEPVAHAAIGPAARQLSTQQPATVDASELTSMDKPVPAPFGAEPFRSAPSAAVAAQLGMQRNMQDEIRARIARFRAHQERFNRERQEYFSATLARLRASIEQTPQRED